MSWVEKNRCGYCRETGECRIDPRTLPCGHACCLPCITADFKRTNTVICPVCRFVSKDWFDIQIFSNIIVCVLVSLFIYVSLES